MGIFHSYVNLPKGMYVDHCESPFYMVQMARWNFNPSLYPKKHVLSFFRLLIHMNTTLTSPFFLVSYADTSYWFTPDFSPARDPGSSGRRRCHSWPSGWRSCCFWRGPSGASCRSRLLWKWGKIWVGWLMGKSSRHEGLIWENLLLHGGAIHNRP